MDFNIKETIDSSFKSSILILKLVIPLYIFADILIYFGWLEYVSFIFEPITNVLHLPSSVALSLAAGIFLNLYAAIAFAAPLGLSSYEWTILGLFLGICHSLLIESAIMKKIGVSLVYSYILRISVAFLAVVPLWYMPKDWFSSNVVSEVDKKVVYSSFFDMFEHSLYNSMILSIKIIILIVFIIFLMDFIKSINIIKKYQQKVSTSFSIIAGLILGITYGAGVLLKEARSGSLSKKDILFIGTFLMICHSIIEDTLLFVIFGANYWIMVLVRIILALIVSYIAVKVLLLSPDP